MRDVGRKVCLTSLASFTWYSAIHSLALGLLISEVRRGGRWTKKPYNQYNGTLPDTMTAGRPGLETLMRRMVLGDRYRNIQQVIGTVTGVSRDASNSRRLDHVMIRTAGGTQESKRQ